MTTQHELVELQSHEGTSETTTSTASTAKPSTLQSHEGTSETQFNGGEFADALLQSHEGTSETLRNHVFGYVYAASIPRGYV